MATRATVLKLIALAFAVMTTGNAVAAATEGRDYTLITPVQPTSDPKKIVVTEYFSYQCPHCFMFSRPLAAWAKRLPADVRMERVPVALGRPAWEPSARAYFALTAMKSIDRLDGPIFSAIHEKRLGLDTEQSVVAWIKSQGIDANAFRAQYNSFWVNTQMRMADGKSRDLRIPSIPALVVDGRYFVAVVDNGSFNTQLAMVSELIAMARKEKAAKK